MKQGKCDICKKNSQDIVLLNDRILEGFKACGYSIDKELYGKTIRVCRACFMDVYSPV